MKLMLRWDDWKYCYFANGGRQQLFNLRDDPHELEDRAGQHPSLCREARERLVRYFRAAGHRSALDDAGGGLRAYPYERLPLGQLNRQHAIWPQNEPM